MQFRNVYEHSRYREANWVNKHGQHEYEKHDLIFETLEELADAYNYIQSSDIRDKENILNALLQIYEMVMNNVNNS